jgi:threonine dehydrogenase-like Zn-dependent dehydrogenase
MPPSRVVSVAAGCRCSDSQTSVVRHWAEAKRHQRAVDCVGLECHGYGPDGSSKNVEEAVVNTMVDVIKPAGAMGIPGVYTNLDPGAPTDKKGLMALGFPAAWVKSATFTAGQCPVMHDAGRNAHLSGRVAVSLMSDEARASLAEPPAIARIDVLGAKLPETGS